MGKHSYLGGHKFLIHFIVISLLIILTGKLLFSRSIENGFLYLYGILVTSVVFIQFFVTFTRYKDPYVLAKSIPKSQKKKYLVSCLVAVKDEEKLIGKCIESLINQEYENKEIIVINDCSIDGTQKILKGYARKKLITLINLKKNVGKKRALGRGLLRSNGKIILFTDSDSILAPDATTKIVDAFNLDPLIGAVSGHCRALNGDKNIITKMQDSWYEGQFSIRKAFESVFNCVTCVSGPLAGFRREAIFNLIPAWINDNFLGQEFKFATDRTLTGFVLGNGVVGNKLKKKYRNSTFVKREDYQTKNWKVVYCKSAKALTIVPDTLKRMIKQQIRWKKSFIRNIFFTGSFYWRKPILPALVYYLHILFVLVGPFIVFRHLVYLPIHGDFFSAFLYLGGIFFLGSCFGLAYKLENRECHKWVYRPLMSLFSTLILSWLMFYSILTITKMEWFRG